MHRRLVPGFVIDARIDGEDRIVTFFNGSVVRELLVDRDDKARRLVWSAVDGPYTHHNASAQVVADGATEPGLSGSPTRCRTASAPRSVS